MSHINTGGLTFSQLYDNHGWPNQIPMTTNKSAESMSTGEYFVVIGVSGSHMSLYRLQLHSVCTDQQRGHYYVKPYWFPSTIRN